MDFLRLALERCINAESALHTMVKLLEVYGQAGNCGYAHKMYYNNSYLLADPQEAWVLETAGKQWAAQKVRDVRSISNVLSIEDHWDLASDDLILYALDRGWYKKGDKFNFSQCYSDTLISHFADGRRRNKCTTECLLAHKGSLNVGDMMHALRSHGSAREAHYQLDHGLTGAAVCMHAGFGPVRGSQTTGSMVSELHQTGMHLHWLTGTAAPCTGIFKPFWMDAIPEFGKRPEGKYDENCIFWQHEVLHREVLRAYDSRLAVFSAERNTLEEQFLATAAEKAMDDAYSRKAWCEQCIQKSQQALGQWIEKVRQVPSEKQRLLYTLAWQKFNRQAAVPLM